jgi:hypothetical protein
VEIKDTEIKEALRLWAEEEERAATTNSNAHPSADELFAYQANRLSPSDADGVQNHLIFCRECADWLLDLAVFNESDDFSSAALSAAAAEFDSVSTSSNDRAAFQAGIESKKNVAESTFPASATDAVDKTSLWQKLTDFFTIGRLNFALAGMLLLMTVGLGVTALTLYRRNQDLVARLEERQNAPREREIVYQPIERPPSPETSQSNTAANENSTPPPPPTAEELEAARRQAEESRRRAETAERRLKESARRAEQLEKKAAAAETIRPQVNVPLVEEVFLNNRDVSGGGGAETVELPADAKIFTAIIPAPAPAESSNAPDAYNLVVTTASGRRVTAAGGLRPDKHGSFTIALPRSIFPAGAYRFKLYPAGGSKPAAEYTVRFRYK